VWRHTSPKPCPVVLLRPMSVKIISPAALTLFSVVVSVVIFAWRANAHTDMATVTWGSAPPWDISTADRSTVEIFLSFEESLMTKFNEEWMARQVMSTDMTSKIRAHEIDILALEVGAAGCVTAAKRRTFLSGGLRRVSVPFYRPIVGSEFALVCSSYGDLGAIAFKVDRASEPDAYDALAAIAEMMDSRPGLRP
jgi:hypothetical protein